MMRKFYHDCFLMGCIFAVALLLGGCAGKAHDPSDPYEGFNRVMYNINNDVDHILLHPMAVAYKKVTPTPLQKGITNVFANVGQVPTVINDVLQGKVRYALIGLTRLVINTSVGVGGLFDIATRAGLPKHSNDFGLTLAYYSNTDQSPYLVLPFFGPTTFRDAFARSVDFTTNPVRYIDPSSASYAVTAVRLLNTRARFLSATKLASDSFDPYAFIRNAYLQNRLKQIQNNRHDYDPQDLKHQVPEEGLIPLDASHTATTPASQIPQ